MYLNLFGQCWDCDKELVAVGKLSETDFAEREYRADLGVRGVGLKRA